jgi:hypothetical protein
MESLLPLRQMQVERGDNLVVEFGAEDENNVADIEKHQRCDDAAQASVNQIYLVEIREIERKQLRRADPGDDNDGRAGDYRHEALLDIGDDVIDVADGEEQDTDGDKKRHVAHIGLIFGHDMDAKPVFYIMQNQRHGDHQDHAADGDKGKKQ